MHARLALLIALVGTAGCDGMDPMTPTDAGPQAAADAGPMAEPDAGPGAECLAGQSVVELMTQDGVTLSADFHSSGVAGGPAVALFHMVPPANTRTNYPPAFIELLTQRGFHVLNVDRRGAGTSGGVAQEAYFGPNGKWDVLAAYRFLVDHACAIDPTAIGLVGASNGTTSVLDFTVWSATQADIASPAALVWLTPDRYTEAQNAVAANRPVLDTLPILFVFSSAEGAWSTALVAGEGDRWMFHEYVDGAHGTLMFQARPDSMARVADFLQTNI